MGLRRLLSRTPPAEDPLVRFAELGRKQDDTPGLFAEQATQAEVAPVQPVVVDKKTALERPVFRREGRRPSYVWVSQKSRESLALPDQLWRPF